MAAFASIEAAELRAKAMVAAGTWVNAHSERLVTGEPCVRFQRFLTPGAPAGGEWVETTDDGTV